MKRKFRVYIKGKTYDQLETLQDYYRRKLDKIVTRPVVLETAVNMLYKKKFGEEKNEN